MPSIAARCATRPSRRLRGLARQSEGLCLITTREPLSDVAAASAELEVLYLLGLLFDRPADAGCLDALRAKPPIPGLTDRVVELSDAGWDRLLDRLEKLRLVHPESRDAGPPAIDAHPLLREYFAKQGRERQPEAWSEGHRRLYEYLKSSVPHRPEGLGGLQPLYQAVAHGCQAGLHQQACDEVYRDRIFRGTGGYAGFYYSTKKLGAFGADLGAVACFFEVPWKRLAPGLSEGNHAWLLNEAAMRLHALGWLSESLEPMRASLDMCVQQQDWKQAAIRANNLSELELTLGELAAAVRDADQSVAFADKPPSDWQISIIARTMLADARYQSGGRANALALFREAESMQAEQQPEYSLLYSLRGFRYCDLLFGEAERMAWATSLASRLGATDRPELEPLLGVLREVEQRAAQALKMAQEGGLSLLTHALDRLTLGRVALYRGVLDRSSFEPAYESVTAAVDSLRASGKQDYVPRGLLTRAWLRFMEGDPEGAKADLDQAWQIAERGSMKLHMADTHLHRARLFRDRAALEAAARLIEETGYHLVQSRKRACCSRRVC